LITAGIDEAGRGALAGPVIACCVILKPSFCYFSELNDSKKLTEKKRITIFNTIKPHLYLTIGAVSHKTIESINILNATLLAMKKSINKSSQPIDHIIIDGNKQPKTTISCETKVKADATVPQVQAASICAKVIRDLLMQHYNKKYPGYNFDHHKGYGTKQHYDIIQKKGPSPIHRLTFNLNKQLTLW